MPPPTNPSVVGFWSVCRFFGYGFLLHLAWENAQAPLYEGFMENAPQHLWACIYATATGDMAFSLSFTASWLWFTGRFGGRPIAAHIGTRDVDTASAVRRDARRRL
jgi:hypothetical protein